MTAHSPDTTSTSSATLIAEDVLLLLLEPASGTFRGEGSPLFHVLAGAVLTELAVDGWAEIDDRTTIRGRQVRAVTTDGADQLQDGPADPLLRGTWERLVAKPTDVYSLILEIGPSLRAPMIDRLAERGHIRLEAKKLLGLIPNTAIIDGGTSRRAELLAPVRATLVDEAEPDPRTASLIALLSASGQLPAMHPEIPWSGAVYTRGIAIQQGDWGADAASAAVARTTAAILSTALFVTLTAPAVQGD